MARVGLALFFDCCAHASRSSILRKAWFDCAFTLHGHMFWAGPHVVVDRRSSKSIRDLLIAGNGKTSCSKQPRCRVVCWGGGAAVKVAATV